MFNRLQTCGTALVLTLLVGAGVSADPRRQAPVPAGLELEVLDPGVDSLGNPAVVTMPDAGGQLQVDIPQTVIVHRYYYTGDRKFQGPLLPGGPAIVVVNHPRTGERCYIEMQMLPGAPRVIYTAHSIEYDYGKQGITLTFCCLGSPKVTYRNCKPVTRQVGAAATKLVQKTKQACDRTGLRDLGCKVKDGTKSIANGAVDGVKTVGKVVLTPIGQIVQVLPGAKMLSTNPEQRAATARNDAVRRAADANLHAADSIATVR